MTAHHSTISNEIDFKLRCIAHFKKVYDKCVGKDIQIQRQMLDQTKRADADIFKLIDGDAKLNKVAGKLVKKYEVRAFIEYAIAEMS